MDQAPQGSAAALCSTLALDDNAKQLLREDQSPREFFDLLLEHKLYPDAVRVLAGSMTKQRAVEWACICAREGLADSLTADDHACLAAAERWVAQSNEATRLAALEAAASREYSGPTAWVAAAAGWSTGSVVRPGEPAQPPMDHLTAQTVAGSVIVLAAREPEEFEERQLEYLERGLELADE